MVSKYEGNSSLTFLPLCALRIGSSSLTFLFAGIFERFRGILHEGEIDKRVQFLIEELFAIRKAKFQVCLLLAVCYERLLYVHGETTEVTIF